MTATPSAPLSAEQIDIIEQRLLASWVLKNRDEYLALISMARDVLALRRAAQRVADEAQRMIENPGRGPGGLQRPLVDVREALATGRATERDDDMAGMLAPHPGVPIEIRETNTMPRRWLLMQRNPVHGWDDQLWIGNSREEAEQKRAVLLAGPMWNAAAGRATAGTT